MFSLSSERSSRSNSSRSISSVRHNSPVTRPLFRQDCDFTFPDSQTASTTPASSVSDLSSVSQLSYNDPIRASSSWVGDRLALNNGSDSESESETTPEIGSVEAYNNRMENTENITTGTTNSQNTQAIDNMLNHIHISLSEDGESSNRPWHPSSDQDVVSPGNEGGGGDYYYNDTHRDQILMELTNNVVYSVEEYMDNDGEDSGNEADHNVPQNAASSSSLDPTATNIPFFLHNTFLVRDTMHDLIETIGLPSANSVYNPDLDRFLKQSSLDVVQKRHLLPDKIDTTYLSLDGFHLDYQGIEWNQTICPRASFDARLTQLRRKRYVSYTDHYKLDRACIIDQVTTKLDPVPLFRYKAMFTKPKLFIPHFQIRQLLCPLSKNALFYSLLSYDDFNIQRLDPETGNVFTVIGANQIQPMYNRTCVVSSMDVNDDFLVAGCYDGQYIYRSINSIDSALQELQLEDKTTDDQLNPEAKLNVGSTGIASGVLSNDTNDMINHTNIISRSHLPPQVIFSSNEGTVIMLDLKTNQIINTYQAPDSMNCTSYCPTNPNIKLLQGDFKTSLIIDTNSSDCQRPLLSLEGQLDFGSACAWSPRHNYIVATGNQDGFCRIYDLRFVKPNSKPLHSLMTDYELPVRSMRFDKGGRFLMFAEPVDNVTILDATTDFKQGQTLNVLGEIAGIGFNDDADDGQCVSIGIADTYIGGIMQFSRGNDTSGLDNMYF